MQGDISLVKEEVSDEWILLQVGVLSVSVSCQGATHHTTVSFPVMVSMKMYGLLKLHLHIGDQ